MLNSNESKYAIDGNVLNIADIVCSRVFSANIRKAKNITIIKHSNAFTVYDDGEGLDISNIEKQASEKNIPSIIMHELQTYHQIQFINKKLEGIQVNDTLTRTKLLKDKDIVKHIHFDFSELGDDGQVQVKFDVSTQTYNKNKFYSLKQGVIYHLFLTDDFFSNVEYLSFKKTVIHYGKSIKKTNGSLNVNFQEIDNYIAL